jgi:uncharacterized protein (DUF302 family)
MSYYFNKNLGKVDFDNAIGKVTEHLKAEGFGVLTEIDIKTTLKNKIDVDFRKYKILGACNPGFAHKALTEEENIGVFLPCNVVVQENDKGEVEVSAVDPVASMISVKNESLSGIAGDVQNKLKKVVEGL